MKFLKRILGGLLWTLVGLYLLLVVLTHIQPVQRFIASKAAEALEEKIGSRVSVGSVNLGFLNRVIIDDVEVYDQRGKRMLRVARMSAKLDIDGLAYRELGLGSVQLFGFNGNLYRDSIGGKGNWQFMLDSLASKDTTSESAFDSYHVNDIIISRGQLKYDVLNQEQKVEALDLNHLSVSDISTHINLRHISSDSINVYLKKLSMTEQSGFDLRKASLTLIANKKKAVLEDFYVQLPHSMAEAGKTELLYRLNEDGSLNFDRLRFNLNNFKASVATKDIAPLLPALKDINETADISINAKGAADRIKALAEVKTTGGTEIKANVNATKIDTLPRWTAELQSFNIAANTISNVTKALQNSKAETPEILNKIGDVNFRGLLRGQGIVPKNANEFIAIDGKLTTGLGAADLAAQYKGNKEFAGTLTTKGIDIAGVTGKEGTGTLVADIEAKGRLAADNKLEAATLKGDIGKITYNGKEYNNIHVDGQWKNGIIDGLIDIDDPDIKLNAQGTVGIGKGIDIQKLTANVERLDPFAAKLLKLPANAEGGYVINNLNINAGNDAQGKFLNLDSPFLTARLNGQYDYTTLHQSFINLIGNKLPTLPGLPKTTKEHNNNFTLQATMHDTEWLNKMFGVDLKTDRPTDLAASISDNKKTMTLHTDIPWLSYNGSAYRNTHIDITTPGDTLTAHITTDKVREESKPLSLAILAKAIDNHLQAKAEWNSNTKKKYEGELNCKASFAKDEQGRAVATINVMPSEMLFNDTAWHVGTSEIKYRKKHIDIQGLKLERGQQHLIVSGTASENPNDVLVADLNKINVEYIMNILNFHSVEFGGMASGKAMISNVFNTPALTADIRVDDFLFQYGNLGTLYANAVYNQALKQIDITAHADESLTAQTLVNGNVSPERNDIDLMIEAHNTNADFAKSFCGSFMDNIKLRANGAVNLKGSLSEMQLLGMLTVEGTTHITPIGTTYTLKDDTIKFIPDDIIFERQVFHDKDGNKGIITGGLHHQHLTKLTFDINVDAENLLCYDFKDFGDATFCGTVYGDGKANISQRGNDILIDIDLTPKKNTIFTYNASSPESVSGDDFITWTKKDTLRRDTTDADMPSIPANIYMNLLINTNQDATIKLLMDSQTNDYIALNGDGGIRGAFFNKGTLDLYGTYTVNSGVYKLTIQKIIKKDFRFQPGGTIVFGGDPMRADLDLKALYTVNGVSLSDLDPSNTFSTNTIRVNCFMNIHGQPQSPVVDFDLELPTVNSDEQQMVKSILNGQENMNQQVLYLLAIGRFYNDGSNNAAANSNTNQTNRAMQSIFSGALSTQINSVLSSVIKNDNWNFGANISTGTEGWNNAEYEGLVSGKMLNNRLLINGQFGYKDKASTASQSFVGDFDIRYLFNPRGTLALKVYNQTNDRYFTKSSLNTQGIGIIAKKDFTRIGDIFRKKSKRKNTDTAENKENTAAEKQDNADSGNKGNAESGKKDSLGVGKKDIDASPLTPIE